MLPNWYATPGKVARNAGGLISARSTGITPHAPCTPNWMQNAPAESLENVLGRIHRGMKAPISMMQRLSVGD